MGDADDAGGRSSARGSGGVVDTTVVAGDGTRLFVESKDGAHTARETRLILCDGVACDGFIWKYLWDDLAPLGPLTHWHYRGHGRSAPPADPTHVTIADHAGDLASVRASLGDPPCVLVGHSMGCQVALENCRDHRANVRGLVLLCGGYGKLTSTFHDGPILEMILPSLLDLATKSPDLVRAVWSRLPVDMAVKIALKLGEVDPEKVRPEDLMPYLTHVTHVDVPMFLRMVEAAGQHTAEELLPTLDMPVLIIAGERDTFTPAHLAASMQKKIPRSELLVVERGSHVAPLEQPEVVRDRIFRFFRERVAPLGVPLVALLALMTTTACKGRSNDRPEQTLVVPIPTAKTSMMSFPPRHRDGGSSTDANAPASTATASKSGDAGAPDDSGGYATAAPLSGKSIGHTSVVFKLALEQRLVAAYKPESKRGPGRYKGEIAAYRLGHALGLTQVPLAIPRWLDHDALLKALGGKETEAGALLESEGVADKMGRVHGALIPWIPHLTFLPLEADPSLSEWKAWLAGTAEIPADKRSLAAQISTMIVFDYVTGNWDRWSGGNVGFDATTGTLLFVDNDGAFYDHPPPGPLAAQKGRLESVHRYSRRFVEELRHLEAARLESALGTDGTAAPLIGPRALAGVIGRQHQALAVIDADIAKLGADKVLAFE